MIMAGNRTVRCPEAMKTRILSYFLNGSVQVIHLPLVGHHLQYFGTWHTLTQPLFRLQIVHDGTTIPVPSMQQEVLSA